jgi:hypothetical protein
MKKFLEALPQKSRFAKKYFAPLAICKARFYKTPKNEWFSRLFLLAQTLQTGFAKSRKDFAKEKNLCRKRIRKKLPESSRLFAISCLFRHF